MAWHLSHLREDAQVSISYTLVKALYPVRAWIDDVKVTLDEVSEFTEPEKKPALLTSANFGYSLSASW
jgi:hypothetical protein